MKTLLDFIQSMSNAVADNVAGPVDLLGLGLNKIGVPVGDSPIGGTNWQKQMGLRRDVDQGAARVLGETAGLLGPAMLTKFAPQIARAANQGVDNLAAPQRLNPQTGAIVWHGSPHKFDKFDSSKIGTGEGAQAYGHGIYTAQSPDVARSYVQSVVANSDELAKRGAAYGLPDDVASNLIAAKQSGKNFETMFDAAKKAAENPLLPQSQKMAAQRLVDHEMQAYNAWSDWSKPGNLYKVDLPDEHIAKMLDWDKPLSQQAPEVQRAIGGAADDATGTWLYNTIAGKGIVQRKYGGEKGAVEAYLRDQGIPGIRYLDGGSRGAGQGSSNFVVFPGNEDILKILERNGRGLLD